MTDKKMIIDGVDVSKCNFRLERDNQQKCECSHATGFGVICNCNKWHNCYFKQLKRQEQKNENLNEVTIQQRKENTELTIKLGEMINRGGELCGELQKYKQALDKISKEIDTIIRVDGNSFDDALTKEFALIQDIINKAKEK